MKTEASVFKLWFCAFFSQRLKFWLTPKIGTIPKKGMVIFMNIFIAGLGLIGGSLAKALKKSNDCLIYGFDSNEASINQALYENMLDYGYTDILNKKFDCDVVIVATPPSIVAETIARLIPRFGENTLFTDVCSVKGNIISEVSKLPCRFVGGHPMAGTEKSGYENSKDDLFIGARYILTEDNPVLSRIIDIIGAEKVIIPYEQHDYLVGVISHIPHIISAGLVNFASNIKDNESLTKLAGGGFRDITRISSSSEYMWQQIIFSNKENMLSQLNDFEKIINDMKINLENDNIDYVLNFFRNAKEFRGEF